LETRKLTGPHTGEVIADSLKEEQKKGVPCSSFCCHWPCRQFTV